MLKIYQCFLLNLVMGLSACDGNSLTTKSKGDSMSNSSIKCENLHKVIDVDDLVQQMYANIDSTCLFDMPSYELESTWGIKIFDFSETQTNLKEVVKQRWAYHEQGLGLYLVKFDDKSGINYQIFPTKKFALENSTWGPGRLAQGFVPSNMPMPYIPKAGIRPNHPVLETRGIDDKNHQGDFTTQTTYVWLNAKNSVAKPFLMMDTSNKPYISTISFYKNALDWPPFQKYFDR